MKLNAKTLDEAEVEARKTIAAADDPKALFVHDVDRALLRGAIHDGRGPVLTLALVDGIREARALTENLEIRLMETERARLVAEAQVASTQRLLDETRAACDRAQAQLRPARSTANIRVAVVESEMKVLHGKVADLMLSLREADTRYLSAWRRSISGPICAFGCSHPTWDEAARVQGWDGTCDVSGAEAFAALAVLAARTHIVECPNHPMRSLERERDELRADVRRLRGLLDAEAVNVSQLNHRAEAAESRANEAEALTVLHEGRIARMEAEAAAAMERAVDAGDARMSGFKRMSDEEIQAVYGDGVPPLPGALRMDHLFAREDAKRLAAALRARVAACCPPDVVEPCRSCMPTLRFLVEVGR